MPFPVPAEVIFWVQLLLQLLQWATIGVVSILTAAWWDLARLGRFPWLDACISTVV
ncbi:MAG: hypothetical protein J6C11_12430 [Spirochaetaceae bacterium]|nr:hypothetical protein [Spirochaetaceae bacterium]